MSQQQATLQEYQPAAKGGRKQRECDIGKV